MLRRPPEHMALLGEMRRRLRVAAQERGARGLLPFEGRWFSREELDRLLARRRWKLWLIAVEIVVVLAFVAAISAAMIGLTALVAY